MAYYSGTVNNLTELRLAIGDACALEGWDWDSGSGMLSKGAMFLRLQVSSDYLQLLGRTSEVGGDAPNGVGIGPIGSEGIVFPAQYEIFAFPGEVYVVLNHSVDVFQWLAFGQSTVSGLPGSGLWVGGSRADALSSSGVSITPTGGGSWVSPAVAWGGSYNNTQRRNFWLHSDIDNQGWWINQTLNGSILGNAETSMVSLLPNSWNSEAVLLPIRAYKRRASNMASIIADLEHARHTRIDNYEPGEVITVGHDRWKIFPWYRKDSAARDGGNAINHSGTLGWAIRYEGP